MTNLVVPVQRRLEGRTAVVTGASRGMGRAFAAALVEAGVRVALLARPSSSLDETAAALGEGSLAIGCDVSDPASVRHAFSRVGSEFAGSLDILVNNAGISLLGRVEELSDEAIRNEIGVNLMGPMFTTREAIPLLRRSRGGDIVNISSESVKLPWPYLTVYAATKSGLETFTAGLRSELRRDGIRVTALRAGFVTGGELARNWSTEQMKAFYAATAESGHLGMAGKTGAPPEAMAETLLALLTLPRDVNVDLAEIRPTAP